MNERDELAIERIRSIVNEDTVNERYRDYFLFVAHFILEIDAIKNRLVVRSNEDCTLEEAADFNINNYLFF